MEMFSVSCCEVMLEEQFVVGSCNLFFFSLEFGQTDTGWKKGEIIDFFFSSGDYIYHLITKKGCDSAANSLNFASRYFHPSPSCGL